ncbi:MAG: hypothetical protein FJ290_10765 [Planctomycetes bacterium]|nr:hypothetical protein [Planctomycetota bacterium]
MRRATSPQSLILALIACAASALGGAASRRDPHIGYLFPAGGRQGTAFEVLAGGQALRGAAEVIVSGDGVRASVAHYCPPVRNLQPEQREELIRRLAEVKAKRVAELPPEQRTRVFVFPGERPARKDSTPPTKAEPVKLPDHYLLRDLDSKNLRHLLQVANEFLNFREREKKRPNAQLAEVVVLQVTIEAGAAAGDRELRLRTPAGLSNPICFQVGTLPEAREQEPNDPGARDPLPKDPPLALPVVLNGQILPGDVDRFRFQAKHGQQLVLEVHARRLIPFLADAVPGWFQATVALYDAKGKEVAFADDYRFSPDPVLLYRVPADGEYELEARDAIYRGREDFVYRIAIGELPFITQIFPMGGRAGIETVAVVGGWNLPAKQLPLDTRPGGDPIRQAALWLGKRASNAVCYAVDALPETAEAEPNDDAKGAQRLVLPRIVNGRIGRPGDLDVFQFDGRAGDTVVAEVQARRLHSPLDSLLRLTDAAGNVVAWNDDHVRKDGDLYKDMGSLTHHADSYLTARLPKDGAYRVQVSDAQNQGSDAHAYRLRVSGPQPDFALLMSPSSLSVPAGGLALLTVHALRKDGFAGDIELALKDAPAGFALDGGRIPTGRDRVRITLAAPAKPLDRPVVLRLEGRAELGGKTLTRPVSPSDDVMQAFLYRHLAPSRELMMAVTKSGPRGLPAELAQRGPVRVPANGSVQVRLKTTQRPGGDIKLALNEPPEGVTLHDVKPLPDGLAFQLRAQGAAAKVGFADNLIVEVTTDNAAQPKGKGAGKGGGQSQRISLGLLPAIPFVVVQP